MNLSVYYNGLKIEVIPEHGHYCLKNGNREQRCDVGELNEAIPDFAQILSEEMEKRKKVTA